MKKENCNHSKRRVEVREVSKEGKEDVKENNEKDDIATIVLQYLDVG